MFRKAFDTSSLDDGSSQTRMLIENGVSSTIIRVHNYYIDTLVRVKFQSSPRPKLILGDDFCYRKKGWNLFEKMIEVRRRKRYPTKSVTPNIMWSSWRTSLAKWSDEKEISIFPKVGFAFHLERAPISRLFYLFSHDMFFLSFRFADELENFKKQWSTSFQSDFEN